MPMVHLINLTRENDMTTDYVLGSGGLAPVDNPPTSIKDWGWPPKKRRRRKPNRKPVMILSNYNGLVGLS